MRNQISGSISLDVSSLADAIAERLNQPPALTPLSGESATEALSLALANATGLQSHGDAGLMVEFLRRRGLVLAKLPDHTHDTAAPATDWFQRTTD